MKAVQMGGPAGGCLPPKLFNLPVDYESLSEAGAPMGSGGVIVMDEKTCMVDMARYFMKFSADESCGKCVPCRVGTTRMLELLTKICRGQGTEADLLLLLETAVVLKDASFCGLGQAAANPFLSTVEHFRNEYDAHIKKKVCPAGVCDMTKAGG
jgi:NADH:ubiquinone oxidoreductase subunit F (NADH-binding)